MNFFRFGYRFSEKVFKINNIAKSIIAGTCLYVLNQYSFSHGQKVKNCGIIAYIGTDEPAIDVIMDGLELLRNRGYDSAGIATVDFEGQLAITKLASDPIKKIDCIDKLKSDALKFHKCAKIGIGHTRWATCGGKTDLNAHPHTDYKNRIALVHNGTLENIEELRDELKIRGIPLRSQTDTEVKLLLNDVIFIAQFIGVYIDEGYAFVDAVKKTLSEKIHGTWGLAIMNKEEPNKLIVCRNGSPMCVGMNPNSIYISSESSAFQKHVNNYLTLKDGEIMMLDLGNNKSFNTTVRSRIQKLLFVDSEKLLKVPYTTFYEQEMMEQPEALIKCLSFGARLSGTKDCTKLGGLDENKDKILGITNLIIVACGSSYFAGLYASRIFKMLKTFDTIQVIQASEFSDLDIPENNPGVLVISQSGENKDVYAALTICKKMGVPSIGAVNVVGSLIATEVDCGVYLNCGKESAIPATKSFTTQIAVLSLIAIWISHNKQIKAKYSLRTELKSHLHALPLLIGKTLSDIKEKCIKLGHLLSKEQFIIVIGKGFGGSIAQNLVLSREGALKLKEVAYIHADAYYAGELKHGSIALIESNVENHTKIILIILNDEYLNDMCLTLSEIKANKAYSIVITDCYSKLPANKIDEFIEISELGLFTGLLAVLPFQMIAYTIGMLKDINVDKPRNRVMTSIIN